MIRILLPIFLLVLNLCSTEAKTGELSFLIEPEVGGILISSMEQSDNGSEFESSQPSLVYGGKVGVDWKGIFFGGSFSTSERKVDFEIYDSTQAQGSQYTMGRDLVKQNQISLFAGYRFGTIYKFWFSYFPIANMKGVEGAGTNEDFGSQTIDSSDEFSGSGFGVGFGYEVTSFMDFNLEWRSLSYDEWEDTDASPASGEFGDSASSGQSNIKITEIFLSVSFPLRL